MSKNGVIAAAVVGLVMATGSPIATPARAEADCPSGEFCVWTETGFRGQRAGWTDDQASWDGWISDNDSSWVNHGTPSPGAKDHVEVFNQAGQVTICLTPGQEVEANAAADGKGHSHTWTTGC